MKNREQSSVNSHYVYKPVINVGEVAPTVAPSVAPIIDVTCLRLMTRHTRAFLYQHFYF
jgi:hypothetical protein